MTESALSPDPEEFVVVAISAPSVRFRIYFHDIVPSLTVPATCVGALLASESDVAVSVA